MGNIEELFRVISAPEYKQRYAKAKADQRCLMCSEKATEFQDRSSEFEYQISGLCQFCQERFFK